MGLSFSFRLAVGYEFTVEEIEKVFGVKKKQRSHMEKRWDPKSGKRLPDEKVIDEPGGISALKYKDIVDDLEGETNFVEELASRYLDCHVIEFGDFGSGQISYIFCPDIKDTSEVMDFGSIDVSGEMEWSDVAAAGGALAMLCKRLRGVGLKPKAAVVKTTCKGS